MKLKRAIFILLIGLTPTLSGLCQTTDNKNYTYVDPEDTKPETGSINLFSFGFGAGGYYPYEGPAFTATPSLSFYFDNTTFKHVGPGNITLGVLFSFKQIATGYSDYNGIYNYYQEWNYYIFGTRAAYHLTPFESKKFDVYAGGMLGYYLTKFKFTSNDPYYGRVDDPGNYLSVNHYPNFFAASIFAGVRSWFNNSGCVWADIGYGYTTFNFGFSYKL